MRVCVLVVRARHITPTVCVRETYRELVQLALLDFSNLSFPEPVEVFSKVLMEVPSWKKGT